MEPQFNKSSASSGNEYWEISALNEGKWLTKSTPKQPILKKIKTFHFLRKDQIQVKPQRMEHIIGMSSVYE